MRALPRQQRETQGSLLDKATGPGGMGWRPREKVMDLKQPGSAGCGVIAVTEIRHLSTMVGGSTPRPWLRISTSDNDNWTF